MDIVERLRAVQTALASDRKYASSVAAEAADTIDRLTRELAEAKERADGMAYDWLEFCEAMSLEWGDQQHAANQIVANFNKAAAEARNQALEEAAKVADSFTCGLCGNDGKAGDAIRALKEVKE